MEDKPLKVIVAVDRSAGSGEIYFTKGGRRVRFSDPFDMLRMLLDTVTGAEFQHPKPCGGECDWTHLQRRSSCEHVALGCRSCRAAWCPCDGWDPTADPLMIAMLRSLADAPSPKPVQR